MPTGRRVSLEGSDTVRILLLQRETMIESSFGLFFIIETAKDLTSQLEVEMSILVKVWMKKS